MAIYPCDWSAHRYPGPQRSVYFTLLYPSDLVVGHAQRFCETHFQAIEMLARSHLSDLDEDGQASNVCDECGDPSEVTISCKLYPDKAPVKELLGLFCAKHAQEVGATLKVSNGRRLADR